MNVTTIFNEIFGLGGISFLAFLLIKLWVAHKQLKEQMREAAQHPNSTDIHSLRIGSMSPNFTADSTQGKINFHEWIGDSWCLLVSHPKDFTPVCTTELGKLVEKQNEFAKLNCKIITLSDDSCSSHIKWGKDIREIYSNGIKFPMIDDSNLWVAKLYNMLPQFEPASKTRSPLQNATVRSIFLIAPDKTIRMKLTYPLLVGRNYDEVLRCLKAIQLCDTYPVGTPEGWSPGVQVLSAPGLAKVSKELPVNSNLIKVKDYFVLVKDPSAPKRNYDSNH